VDDQWNAVAVVRDITERKRVAAALRQSHDELRAIYEGMADGMLIAEAASKRVVAANNAICRMLGYSRDELLTLSVMDLHPPDHLEYVLDVFRAQTEGRLTVAENIPVRRKDGSLFYADIACNLISYRGQWCNLGFFRDITERRKSEESLRAEQRTLRRLLKSHDQERKLIAYEIHDGVAQQLVASIMQCQALIRLTADISEEATEVGHTVLELLRHCLSETRHLISGVRPPILDEFGVVTAVRNLIDETERRGGLVIDFHNQVTFDRLEPVLENAVYRIIQESLANAYRHSKTDRVLIELTEDDERIHIHVQDWGVGFAPDEVDETHFGLVGIRERVRLLGGRLSVQSTIGKGSSILVDLPTDAGKIAEGD
jgi:PAS domain S-box-containing protein